MAQPATREKRTARLHVVVQPSKKELWEQIAADKRISLTDLTERAMEREERAWLRQRRAA